MTKAADDGVLALAVEEFGDARECVYETGAVRETPALRAAIFAAIDAWLRGEAERATKVLIDFAEVWRAERDGARKEVAILHAGEVAIAEALGMIEWHEGYERHALPAEMADAIRTLKRERDDAADRKSAWVGP